VVTRGEDAVRREAAILAAIAGPGAPEIVSYRDGAPPELVATVLPPLRPGGLSREAVAAFAADVATVLARAHAAGFAHGPLKPEHLQGAPGRILVGGWSDADPGDGGDDVAELGHLLERLAPDDQELRAIARRALGQDRPTAVALAAALRSVTTTTGPPRRAGLGRAVALAAGATAAAAGIALAATATTSAAPSKPLALDPMPTTMQLGNVVERDGHRWQVGRDGDIVVAGHFQCDGVDAPAIVRPGSGQVWEFASWRAGTGRLVATVPGATSAGIRKDGDCDRLEVRDGQGRWRAVG
jgi:hypothetical protein